MVSTTSTSSLFEFTLTNIDPSIFNTFSDLLGQCISGILVFTLAMVYPYLVFDSLNNRGGGAISLDTLISPPGSLMEIIIGSHNMFGNGTSKSLLLKISFILLIATFSHPISDIFLKFENKQVSEREAWLLSSSTASTPFYSLLGDKINYSGTRALPVQRLLSRTDYIANGLSRFSITTKESSADFNTISITSQGGYDIDMTVFNLTTSSKTKTTKTRSIPLLPIDVECTPWNNEQQQEEEVVNGGTTTTTTLEYYESKNNNNNSTTHSLLRLTTNDTFVPNCNYEIPIIIPTLDNSKEEEKEGKNNAADNNDNDHGYYWNVQSRMILQGRSLSDGGAYKNFVFGFDNNINDDSGEEEEEEEKDSTNGNYSVVLDLTPDETRHGLDRSNNNNNDNWKLGRQIRNQLKYYIGGEDGHTIQVEFSILTSSPVLDFSDGRALYIISSWSYECPSSSNNIMVDDGGSTTTISSLSIENYKEKKKKNQRPTSDDDSGEGCIINMQVLCDRFPEDSDPRIHRIIGRKCQQGELMEVITLQNINIDETILAVYSGTVLRNNGFYENLYNGHVNINSISASYLVTRQVVYGNIPITDVRPVIGIPYVFFMILPLLVALPLLCIVWRRKKHRNTTELPIPKDMWQAMVFAHRDETTIYKFLGSCRTNQDPYPPQPLRLMFGMLSKGSSGNDNSGTTSSSLSPPKARSQPVYGLGTNLTSSNYSAEVTTTTINYTPDGRVLVNKTPYKVTDPNAIIKKDTIKFPNKKTAVEYGY